MGTANWKFIFFARNTPFSQTRSHIPHTLRSKHQTLSLLDAVGGGWRVEEGGEGGWMRVGEEGGGGWGRRVDEGGGGG